MTDDVRKFAGLHAAAAPHRSVRRTYGEPGMGHSNCRRWGKTLVARHARLRRETVRLQLKLEHAEKLLSLQKKLADMMEAIEPTDANEGSSA